MGVFFVTSKKVADFGLRLQEENNDFLNPDIS